MQLTTKVLYATLVILALMFLHSAKVSQDAERAEVLTELKAQQQKIAQQEQEQLIAQLEREERWMKEIGCLARNVYYESRGESLQGQMAVALVTLNRAENPMFPNTICGVVNERKKVAKRGVVCQFSWRCESHTNPKKHIKQSHESYQAAITAILDYDSLTQTLVTQDTLFFHAAHVRPFWRKVKQRLARIDNHIFYRQKPGDRRR
jgi:spore germination cell wall hydrolase CwlJ-like protein